MLNKLFKTSEKKIYAPVKGKIRQLDSLNDGVFSEHLLGEGIVIDPADEVLVAPFDGKITMTVNSKHAIGMKSDSGIEVLLHIGLDTVMMNGESFKQFVLKDEYVKKGEPLISFDINKIQQRGYAAPIIIIIVNSKSYKEVIKLHESFTECLEPLFLLK